MGRATSVILLWDSLFLYLISCSVCKQVTGMKFEHVLYLLFLVTFCFLRAFDVGEIHAASERVLGLNFLRRL
jgi:hypothetical protein